MWGYTLSCQLVSRQRRVQRYTLSFQYLIVKVRRAIVWGYTLSCQLASKQAEKSAGVVSTVVPSLARVAKKIR